MKDDKIIELLEEMKARREEEIKHNKNLTGHLLYYTKGELYGFTKAIEIIKENP